MKEKQIMVPKTIFETSDGQQFENKYDAEKYECRLFFNNNLTNRYRDVTKTGYCVIDSKEEAKILETLSIDGYVQKGFFDHYLDEEVKIPVMVKFRDDNVMDRPTKLVTETDYKWFKEMAEKFQTLCKMYESL